MSAGYEYRSEFDYKLHSYEERLTFAKFQVKSQLRDAYKRRIEENREGKAWGGLMIVILVCLFLSVLMANSRSILVLPGVLLLFASVAAVLFVMPVCIYKVVKCILMWAINKENKLGKWLAEKCEIPTQRSEIAECQTLLNRYNLLSEDLERFREEYAEGRLSLTEREIYARYDNVDYTPGIAVISENCEKLMKFIRILTVILWVLMTALILRGVWEFAAYMISAYLYMYDQL